MKQLHNTLKYVKNLILPQGPEFRQIMFGPCRGGIMEIDFQYQFRQYVGLYEYPLNKYFKKLIKPHYKCFDIGGKGGYNAIMAAMLSKDSVLTFECEPEAVKDLIEIARINKLPIDVVEAYIGNQMSETHKTIDWAAAKYFMPDFIKIDIEGFEVEALEGATEVLSSKKPALIIETHGLDLENRCIEILTAQNYKIKIIDTPTLFPEKRDAFAHNRWLVCEAK